MPRSECYPIIHVRYSLRHGLYYAVSRPQHRLNNSTCIGVDAPSSDLSQSFFYRRVAAEANSLLRRRTTFPHSIPPPPSGLAVRQAFRNITSRLCWHTELQVAQLTASHFTTSARDETRNILVAKASRLLSVTRRASTLVTGGVSCYLSQPPYSLPSSTLRYQCDPSRTKGLSIRNQTSCNRITVSFSAIQPVACSTVRREDLQIPPCWTDHPPALVDSDQMVCYPVACSSGAIVLLAHRCKGFL